MARAGSSIPESGRRAVWLAPIRDGAHRRTEPGQGRRRMFLPRPPWLRTLLEESGLADFSLVRSQLPGCEIRALACVVCSDQVHQSDNLTIWSPELELQRAFHAFPNDAYSIAIVDVHLCADPIWLSHRRTGNAAGGVARMQCANKAHWLVYPAWTDRQPCEVVVIDHEGARDTAAASMKRWAVTGDLEYVPCLQVPDVIFELLVRKRWTHLLCLARWDALLVDRRCQLPRPWGDAWPPKALLSAAHKLIETTEGQAMNPESIHEVASLIRRMAPAFLKTFEEATDEMGERLYVDHALDNLDNWGKQLAERRGYFHASKSWYRTTEILSALRLSRRLKGGADALPHAMERALEILDGGADLSSISINYMTPSQSTLQRMELALACAFMLAKREGHIDEETIQKRVRWAWADSSPQKDFYIIVVFYVAWYLTTTVKRAVK